MHFVKDELFVGGGMTTPVVDFGDGTQAQARAEDTGFLLWLKP
jgi:hypothetical protein